MKLQASRNWNGYVKGGFLPWGGGFYGSAPSSAEAATGAVANVLTYNHFDNRRRDGGFYGGGGVFYGDDGYSRLPARPAGDAGCVDGASRRDGGARRGSPYVIELPETEDPPPIVKKPARVGARH